MRGTRTHAQPSRGRRPQPPTRTAIVCLPPHTPPRSLPFLAATQLRMRGLSPGGLMPHFLTRTRRTSKLIDRFNGVTSGGPLRLLDLDRMRRNAAAAGAAQWLLWQRVVAGTKPAQPFWWFADKYTADPGRYKLERAQADYLAQPRILAMTAFNAVPHTLCRLPTSALEAFQAGHGTYVNLAWLAAVPADAVAAAHDEHGGWLTARSERLADQLAYLTAANTHLASLHPDVPLVAVAISA